LLFGAASCVATEEEANSVISNCANCRQPHQAKGTLAKNAGHQRCAPTRKSAVLLTKKLENTKPAPRPKNIKPLVEARPLRTSHSKINAGACTNTRPLLMPLSSRKKANKVNPSACV